MSEKDIKMIESKKEINERIRRARNKYMREWRKKNREQHKKNQENFYLKWEREREKSKDER